MGPSRDDILYHNDTFVAQGLHIHFFGRIPPTSVRVSLVDLTYFARDHAESGFTVPVVQCITELHATEYLFVVGLQANK
jgi:hypothetical protein